jgi:hypothetical protein
MDGTGTEVVLKVKPFRTVKDVKLSVARRFKVTFADLESTNKKWSVSHPRQIAMALAYKRLRKHGYSLRRISREFGGRDPSTVSFAARKFGLPVDPEISAARILMAQTRRRRPKPVDLEVWESLGGEWDRAA